MATHPTSPANAAPSEHAAPERPRASTAPATQSEQQVIATFCFVDIAGYTALTDTHGEHAAADLIDGFTRLVHEAVDGHGTVHELSGDNAFLVFPDPRSAMSTLAALYRSVAGTHAFPMLRAGMHHGTALLRAKRYFGSSINIAARVAAQAEGGEIICTAAVADALAHVDVQTLQVHALGKVKLRNLPQALDLYRIDLTQAWDPFAIDPVCQMQVDTRDAVADTRFNGTHYWFCSTQCARQFARSPADFV